MGTDLTKKIDVIQIHQPVCIVDHQGFSVRKINETAHLLFEAVTVVLNCFRRHHLAHIGTSGRISDHTCTASDQGDRLVSCLLQTFHQAQRHEMSHMKRICSRVKTDVKSRLSIVNQFPDLFFVCHLGNQAAGNQFVVDFHFLSLLFSISAGECF